MSPLDRWAPHIAPLKFQLVSVTVSYVWPIFQELWSTPGTASRRNAVLKDVRLRLAGLGGARRRGQKILLAGSLANPALW